jgi:hypothetical protein
MFGKPYAEYIRYQLPLLIATAAVGLVRLGLSLAGQPDSIVKYVSMSAIGFASFAYYGVSVRRRGFGNYREMLPLVFNQGLIANGIAVLGIALAVAGMPNIYDVQEFRGPFATPETTPLQHALAHLFVGTTVGAMVGWGFSCIFMALFGGKRK